MTLHRRGEALPPPPPRPDITSLGMPCAHRNEDGSTAWFQEERVYRMGIYSAWVCGRCGAGAVDNERLREAVRECVDDR